MQVSYPRSTGNGKVVVFGGAIGILGDVLKLQY